MKDLESLPELNSEVIEDYIKQYKTLFGLSGMDSSLHVKKLHPEARLPTASTPFAAGLDLYSVEDVEILPQERQTVSTGIAVAIPFQHYGRIAGRSGLASKHGIDTLGGVIDCDFRGEIKVVMLNTNRLQSYIVNVGDRIAQMIIERVSFLEPIWAIELGNTERGEKGWGSSGK